MLRFILFIFFISVLFLCRNERPSSSFNKFSDSTLIRIYDFKDRRLSDSLFQFFSYSNPIYRHEAVLAFASIQDSSLLAETIPLLKDTSVSVRLAAAYALGQTGGLLASRALEEIFENEKDPHVIRAVTEALGKCANLKTVSTLHISDSTDTLRLDGIAWSYYRLGLRGLADSSINKRTAQFLDSSYTKSTRLAAVHYFHRAANGFATVSEKIIHLVQTDPDPDVRMAAVSSLRKIKSASSLTAITEALHKDPDYRVRVNAVKALQNFDFNQGKDALFFALNDSVHHVAVAASESLKFLDPKRSWNEVAQKAREANDHRVQANLFEAALKFSNNKDLTEEVFSLYNKSMSIYQKAALLEALGQSTIAIGFLESELLQSKIHILKSSAASALVTMNKRKDLDLGLKKMLADIYLKAINDGDVAVVGIVASALADSTLEYKLLYKNADFLDEAKSKLTLPKDNEALQALEQALAYFEGRKPKPIANVYNHPIDWKLVKSIAANQLALVKTTKGNIIMQLLVDEAPGSSANFVELARRNYYDSIYFHRVVPNFVIQAGCIRGDGWGSEEYSIRSEFSPRVYKTGTVGMASAGKDTEGTQWFITHSPTPHLDGRYTIFAEVVAGMDVVHAIEVGDRILDVEIK